MKHLYPTIVGMATIASRRESLVDTLESLSGQADEIHVYYNDYEPDPMPHIEGLVQHHAPLGDLGDAAMMYRFTDDRAGGPAYFIPVPDDLIYEDDYVDVLVAGIERYERDAAVGFHGRIQFSPAGSFYKDLPASGAVRCLGNVYEDTYVTILSTAAAAWHSDRVIFSMSHFPQTYKGGNSRNMADVWFSKRLQEKKVPRIVLAHTEGWIRHTDKFDINTTIARLARDDDAVQTGVFNEVEWTL